MAKSLMCGSRLSTRLSECSADCARDVNVLCDDKPCSSGFGTASQKSSAKGLPTDMFCNLLSKVREPLASYQERSGIPRDMDHSFFGLLSALIMTAYQAIITVGNMLLNLFPLADCFLYLCRFILDKSLNICQTTDTKEKICKIVLFIGELIIITLVMMVIFCWIIIPIWQLVSYIGCKLWHTLYSAGSA